MSEKVQRSDEKLAEKVILYALESRDHGVTLTLPSTSLSTSIVMVGIIVVSFLLTFSSFLF